MPTLPHPSNSPPAQYTSSSLDPPKFPFRRPHAFAPPAEYATLRAEAPLSQVQLWDGSRPWLAVRHADVCAILGDERFSKDRTHASFPEMSAAGKEAKSAEQTFVYMDEPGHGRLRNIIEQLFSKANVSRKFPGLIERTVSMLLEGAKSKAAGNFGPFDLVENFAKRVPCYIIYTILGAPASDLELLTWCNDAQVKQSTTPTETSNAHKQLHEYVERLIERKTAKPSDHLISELVMEQLQTERMEKTDVLRLVFPMLVTTTITNLISFGIMILFQQPFQLQTLVADHSLIPAFVDELCRVHTGSAVASYRVGKEDVRFGNRIITVGTGILASNQSANHDKTVFASPETFDLHRQENREHSLAFGHGPRRCVVEWLARAELEAAFAGLLEILPRLQLAIPMDEIKWTADTTPVGVLELPVVFKR